MPENKTASYAGIEVLGTEPLSKLIKSIAKRGKALDRDIHKAGISALDHALRDGQVTPLTQLVDALPQSSRGKAFVVWAEAHAPLTIAKGKGETKVKLKKGRTVEEFRMEEAATTPFWMFTEERDPIVPTLERWFASTKRGLERVVKNDDNVDEARAAEIMAVLEAAIAAGQEDAAQAA